MSEPRRPKATDADQRIGDEVRARRRAVGITQEKLGDALGVSFQQVQKYEKGANRISASRLRQIAAALDVPVTHFYEAAEGVDGAQIPDASDGRATVQAHCAETQRLMRAFVRIEDALVRQRILDLVESAASDR